MANNELHVVFGASGGLGNAVVRELASRGKRVRAVNRSGKANVPEGVEVVKGDASNEENARQICRGATVVHRLVETFSADDERDNRRRRICRRKVGFR